MEMAEVVVVSSEKEDTLYHTSFKGVPLGNEVDGKECIDATENTYSSTKLKKIKQLRVSTAMQGTLCQALLMPGGFSSK